MTDEEPDSDAGEKQRRRPARALPQWIVELEERHKDATRKELSKIIDQKRKHHQKHMQDIYK